MPFLKQTCPVCGKVAQDYGKSLVVGKTRIHILKCGHTIPEKLVEIAKDKHPAEELMSRDGKMLFHYQVESVKFAEKSNMKALIGHAMGLGKTVIALAGLKIHRTDLLPALILCKASLKYQWFNEVIRWCGVEFIPQIIADSNDTPQGFPITICGLDMVRERKLKNGNSTKLNKALKEYGFKTIIIDECQLIKNTEAQRTREVRQICAGKDHVLALSGTPIKNNATEYFSILNILKPDMFYNYDAFCRFWVDQHWDGYKMRYGGIRDYPRFHEKTKDFIIRYEREEVMPELPTVSRNFRYSDLGTQVQLAYQTELDNFSEAYGDGTGIGFKEYANLMGYMAKMRRLTGLAKVEPTVEFAMEFLGSTDRKITLFVHHIDVGDTLEMKLNELMKELDGDLQPVLRFRSELNSEDRQKMIDEFRTNDKRRIMVASTLAGGEGINLQFSSDCYLVEREWNPANEEQAECRFIRIGQTESKVTATYGIAIGTIDEKLAELVERKRQYCAQTYGKEAQVSWDETSLMRELMQILAEGNKKKWSY